MNISALISLLQQQQGGQSLPPVPGPARPLPMGPLQPQGPVGFISEPQQPPTAPAPALDTNFVSQYAGPAPTPPVQRQPGTLEKIALALSGFSAGVQGYGPQFLAQLEERRARPMREYERQREQYEDRRTRGLEIAEDRRARQQARTQDIADRQAQRDFDKWMSDRQFMSQAARDQAQQAFQLEQDARRQRAEIAEQQRREMVQQRRDAALIARDYGKVGARPELARELGEYWTGLREELSPQAAKFESTQARLAQFRMRQAAPGGVSGGAQKAKDNFEAAKGAVISAVQRQDTRAEKILRRKLDAAYGALSRFPGQLRFGIGDGGWPWAELVGAQQPTQPGQPQAVGARAEAKAKLIAVGYSDAEAESELNRLGIR